MDEKRSWPAARCSTPGVGKGPPSTVHEGQQRPCRVRPAQLMRVQSNVTSLLLASWPVAVEQRRSHHLRVVAAVESGGEKEEGCGQQRTPIHQYAELRCYRVHHNIGILNHRTRIVVKVTG